jgi:hypothetical protein
MSGEERLREQLEHEAACACFVQDAAAFIRFVLASEQSWPEVEKAITQTLMHDIGGLERRESCFSPRVSGYAAREEKREWQESDIPHACDFKGRSSDEERI